ncbi:ShlB/FhaC/HecB family hemolysin secretion/activation protein [Altericista sp. CCNU0014]|uniref:ShlB/FhaC/HecB family hemolysin secretion/activation protein n=1 Tax=Altericista sp. CCNU0014 TaxID=3082949 RepID=UPI00385042D2
MLIFRSKSPWRLLLQLYLSLKLGFVTACFPKSTLAQTPAPEPPRIDPSIPNPILPRPPEKPIPIPQPIPQPPLDLPPAPTPAPEEREGLPSSITVARFEFDGNTAFSNSELVAVTEPFTNRPLTFAELLQAEAAVTKKYTEAGYINSGAVIAAGQTLSPAGAVVKIQVIEGGIEEIRVSGTKRLRPNYVRNRLKLATTRPLNQNRLLEALQLLQLDPLIKTISADLSAGSRPETGILAVKVQEAKSFKAEFFADNNRAPSVGSFRRGIRINEGNVLGFGDGFGLEYANTTGSNALNLSYRIPVNAKNGAVTLSGGVSFTEVIEEPFNSLDISGDSYSVEVSFRQPIIQTPRQEFALGITASRQDSGNKFLGTTEFFGPDFKLSPGSDDNGRTRISALRFFQDWTRRGSRDVFALRSQFNAGFGVLDATINDTPPDGRFFDWRGQAQYVRLLAPDTLFVFRSDLQLSPGALVPVEQFALGGQQSVRGYRQDALLTDNGVSASAEVRFPILRVKSIKGLLQIVPFLDFGLGWNSGGTPDPSPNTLVGAGVGLQWQMGDSLNARFDWGIPLVDIRSNKTSLQEQGLYFSINYSPF